MALKIAVVGNCQARPLAQYLAQLSSRVEISTVAVVHLLQQADEAAYAPHLQAADVILAQQVADGYPCQFVTTRGLQAAYGDKVCSWINLYYAGYNPELTYIRPARGGALPGPLGDYHHRFIFEAWQAGASAAECARRCLDVQAHRAHVASLLHEPWRELARRQATADVQILDYLREHIHRTRLFHTMNHPTRVLLLEMAGRVLQCLGLAVDGAPPASGEPLGQFRVPLNPFVKASQGLAFDGPDVFKGLQMQLEGERIAGFKGPQDYGLDELVASFYRLYSQNRELLTDARIR